MVIAHPVRVWRKRALGRSPLTRVADRIEAWAVVAAFVLLVAAVVPALAIGRVGYTARVHEIAENVASRHAVEAMVLGDSVADPSNSESTATNFMVNVQWFDRNATHEAAARIDDQAKAGDRVRIWVTDQDKVTTEPINDGDARATEMGTVILSWSVLAALVCGAFALLRIRLNRVRNRRWDRGWRDLVENGGGSATVTP